MSAWLALLGAGLLEVGWALGLKYSDAALPDLNFAYLDEQTKRMIRARSAMIFGAGLRARPVQAEMLGYDAWTGEALPFPADVVEQVPDWHALSDDPRKYGFHATLKAPMALADGKTEKMLLAACADFAKAAGPFPIITPVVNSISGFIAVIPGQRSGELERLASDCVTAFDPFRAPLSADDRARRNPPRDAAAGRISGPLGLSLRHGGIPFPHDAYRPARRDAPRMRDRDAAGTICAT